MVIVTAQVEFTIQGKKYKPGDKIEVTKEKAQYLAEQGFVKSLIKPIIDKMIKGGNKMKKIALSICLLFSIAVSGMAGSYAVALSTHVPTTTIGQADGSFPNIDGGAKIGEVIITNSGATVQTVTFYKLSESSTTATAIGYVVVPTTGTEKIDFHDNAYNDVAIVKSATGSTVNVTVFYK